ncbi:MAG: hypothetical protein C0448_06585 [Sphingobacteriaceae bacterium]|nr:hypothetical protein [Sphingobacteriaceae bacterium]
MSNLDKHKPLSSEELFQMLDKKSSTEANFDGMDDFEKDALEGFSMHSNPEKARALTEEVNTLISEKVMSTGSVTKNRIIWFSAAASVVLLVMISVFFLNQTKQESNSNLALNETKETVTNPSLVESQKPIETISNSNTVIEEPKSVNTKKAEDVAGVKNSEMGPGTRQMPLQSVALSENETTSATSGLADVSKDNLKNKKEGNVDELNMPSVALDKKTDSKQKEKGYVNSEDAEMDNSIALESKPVSDANAIAQGTATYKADGDYRVAKKEEAKKVSKEKVAAEKSVATTAANQASVPAYASGKEQMNLAYYDGAEVAIKDFVLNYLKEHAATITIKGKYKVIGSVNAKGELKVNSITQISKEYCEGCSDKIKEALNTMKNWNSSSVVEFTLIF